MKIQAEMSDEAAERLRTFLLRYVRGADYERDCHLEVAKRKRAELGNAEAQLSQSEVLVTKCREAYESVFGPVPPEATK